MLYGASRVGTRSPWFLCSLVLLFAVSFSLPLFFTFKARDVFVGSSPTPEGDSFFPAYVGINTPGQHLEVQAEDALSPRSGRDLLISGWFKLSRTPQVLDKILLFSKVDGQADSAAGYIVGLSRDSDTIRPIVYWGDGTNGKWYSFSDIGAAVQGWFMLALSFQEGKYLGLHLGLPVPGQRPEIRLLGGYEVEGRVLAASRAPLRIGAWNEGLFRGRIGPFGVFSPSSMADSLKDVLKSLARDPLSAPPMFATKEVELWVPEAGKDISSYKRTVQFVRADQKRRSS